MSYVKPWKTIRNMGLAIMGRGPGSSFVSGFKFWAYMCVDGFTNKDISGRLIT